LTGLAAGIGFLTGLPGMLLLTCEELSNTRPCYLQVTCNFILTG